MTNKRKKIKIISAAGLILGGLFALSVLLLPWKVEVGKRLATMLEAKGFQGVKLTLGDVGLRGASVKDISVGAETPLVLKSLEVNYTLRDLWNRNLREVTLHGLSLEAVQRDGKWIVVGLENLKGAKDASKPFSLPVGAEDFSGLPFDVLNVAESAIHIAADKWEVSLPLDATLEKAAQSKINYNADQITVKINAITVKTGKAEIRAQVDPSGKAWQGTWNVADIVLDGQGVEVPPLQGEGTITASAGQVLLNGTVKSGDGIYTAAFTLDYRLDKSAPSTITIVTAQMPWQGGRISLKNEKIPLDRTGPLRLDLNLDKIAVNDLMQALTGKRVSATGMFSGTVPVVIAMDGSLSFPEGGLKTDGPGTISMPPDAIPGEGEKLDLVRKVLENFQYVKFSLGVNGADTKGLAVVLSLEGNNPEVENGRLVKLNVNLTGDLLDFIRQNAMLFGDPTALLKKSEDEKN